MKIKDMTLTEMKKMKQSVYLWCESCSAKLYEINKNKLRSPVLASMFMPVAGVGVCWPSRFGQWDMQCPRCGRSPMRKHNEISLEWGDGMRGHIKLTANLPIFTDDGKATCPVCNVPGFDRRGIKTHILYCDGEKTNG